MAQHKHKQLQRVVAAVQERWGEQALHTSNATAGVAALPTGFAPLDRALGIGGVPRGQVTEVCGVPTSGVGTLALKLVASAQQLGEAAAYFDLGQTFDADYAVRCGARLAQTLIARPDSPAEAWDMTQTLLTSAAVGVIVYDPGLHARRDLLPLQRLLPAGLLAAVQICSLVSHTNIIRLFLVFCMTLSRVEVTICDRHKTWPL